MTFFRALLASAALALPGCTALPANLLPANLPASPAAAADQTALDERLLVAVESGWLAAGSLIELAVDGGLIRGETARRVNQIDAAAARAVGAARAAYAAGNAPSYAAAIAQATQAIRDLAAVVERRP